MLIDAGLDLSATGKKGNEVNVEWAIGGGFDGLDEVTHGLGRQWANGERTEPSRFAHRDS
jgi:hypothetical protein